MALLRTKLAPLSSFTFSSSLQTLIFLFLSNLTGRRRTRHEDPEKYCIVTRRDLNSREIPLSNQRALSQQPRKTPPPDPTYTISSLSLDFSLISFPPSVPSPHPSFVKSSHSSVGFIVKEPSHLKA